VSHTVLVCDDAIFMRTMISDILSQAGYEIVGEAESGVQAIERYKQLKPDLVTMDIVMPDLGGIEAVREIVKFDPAARILMCSAMGQQALVVEAIQAGARDFVVKPFQPSRVIEAVQQVLSIPSPLTATPSDERPVTPGDGKPTTSRPWSTRCSAGGTWRAVSWTSCSGPCTRSRA
jgi:two-component system chemotaxis response regulator CheY